MKVCHIPDRRALSGTRIAEHTKYLEIKKKGLQVP